MNDGTSFSKVLACAAVIAIVLSFSDPAFSQRNVYKLKCQPGPDAYLRFPTMSGARRSFDGTRIEYFFRKNPTKAGDGLVLGSCAWMDRPLRGNEPKSLQFEFAGAYVDIYLINVNQPTQPRKTDRRYQFLGNQGQIDLMKHILETIDSGRPFLVDVYAEDGMLKVTSFGAQ